MILNCKATITPVRLHNLTPFDTRTMDSKNYSASPGIWTHTLHASKVGVQRSSSFVLASHARTDKWKDFLFLDKSILYTKNGPGPRHLERPLETVRKPVQDTFLAACDDSVNWSSSSLEAAAVITK